MKKAIINANIVTERGIIWNAVLLMEDNRITAFGSKWDIIIPKEAEQIDAEGTYVGPGFVDIHVHGGNGFSTYYDTEKAAEFFLQHGTTSLLAAPSYEMNFEEFMTAFRSIKTAMDRGKARTVKGIYAEGPYTNPNYGSHKDLNPWRHAINPEEFKALADEAGDYVKVWTVAPEREGIMAFLEYARKVNPHVLFALGHSEATPMQIRALGKYKPQILTHAMCATGRQPVLGGTRSYGPDEYCFKEPDMYAELISDSCGVHVHSEMQQLLLHNKGLHRVILMTDSTVYDDPVPDKFKYIEDLTFDHTGGLAGSKLTMNLACRNIMTHTSCGIAEAFLMASTNPARALGMDDEIGSVEVGKIADLVFVDDKFNVQKVMLGGELCQF